MILLPSVFWNLSKFKVFFKVQFALLPVNNNSNKLHLENNVLNNKLRSILVNSNSEKVSYCKKNCWSWEFSKTSKHVQARIWHSEEKCKFFICVCSFFSHLILEHLTVRGWGLRVRGRLRHWLLWRRGPHVRILRKGKKQGICSRAGSS